MAAGPYLVTRGIVLRDTDTRDADKILTLLTAERGKLSVIARGVCRKGCKFAACAQPLAYSEWTLYKKGDWYYANEGATLELFNGLRADLDAMAPEVIAFSDDGKGVQSESLMREAMEQCRRLGKILAAHCEDNRLLRGGYIHDGAYAKAHSHRGICSESEWGQIARDVRLAEETGCAYHVCHVSTKESVSIIREAKRRGVNVTCETGPHYLTFTEDDLQEDGRFKMNPPLRSREDRDALIEGLLDGTIDMIVTDHAPHSREEKARGLEKSAMGIVGLETAFPLLYTELVKPDVISMERLMELLHDAPCRRFNIPTDTGFTVFDLNDTYRIDPADFLSAGKATPFTGWNVEGRCLLTSTGETIAWYDADRLPKGETL